MPRRNRRPRSKRAASYEDYAPQHTSGDDLAHALVTARISPACIIGPGYRPDDTRLSDDASRFRRTNEGTNR